MEIGLQLQNKYAYGNYEVPQTRLQTDVIQNLLSLSDHQGEHMFGTRYGRLCVFRVVVFVKVFAGVPPEVW
jgi:hypothetical protein